MNFCHLKSIYVLCSNYHVIIIKLHKILVKIYVLRISNKLCSSFFLLEGSSVLCFLDFTTKSMDIKNTDHRLPKVIPKSS